MPRFQLVFYETIRLSKWIEAADLEAAIEKGEDFVVDVTDAAEETLGTDGLAEICDEKGEIVYRADYDVELTQEADWSIEAMLKDEAQAAASAKVDELIRDEEQTIAEIKTDLEKYYDPKDYPEGKWWRFRNKED